MENKEGVRHFYANATELTASPLLTRRVRKLSQKPALFRSLARTQRQLVYVTLAWVHVSVSTCCGLNSNQLAVSSLEQL